MWKFKEVALKEKREELSEHIGRLVICKDAPQKAYALLELDGGFAILRDIENERVRKAEIRLLKIIQ